jgi:hypothetical protein
MNTLTTTLVLFAAAALSLDAAQAADIEMRYFFGSR